MPQFYDVLVQTHRDGHDLRHSAVSRGAKSGKDAEWNAGALLESWSGALLGTGTRRISTKVYNHIDHALITFLTENLTDDEIKSVVEAKN